MQKAVSQKHRRRRRRSTEGGAADARLQPSTFPPFSPSHTLAPSHILADGNSETNDRDDGDGTMEAIYFGNAHWRKNTGAGSGPWVGADLGECKRRAQVSACDFSYTLSHP